MVESRAVRTARLSFPTSEVKFMILNEHHGEQTSALPASDGWLLEPGPVWYTRAAENGQANGVAWPARLVRSHRAIHATLVTQPR